MALHDVRAVCADVAQDAGIRVDEERIRAFLQSLTQDAFEPRKTQHGLRFPLAFASVEDEVNLVAVLALLNAFSGYRIDFHKATGHGAYDNVRRMILGLYLSVDGDAASLSAESLAHVTPAMLAQLLGVPTHTEAPHPTLPMVTVGTQGGPLKEPLELAASMCRDTGAFLLKRHIPSLGAYVLQACEAAAATDDADAAFLAALTEVPAFDDTFVDRGRRVHLWKKAYFLLHAVRGLLERSALPAALAHLRTYYAGHAPAPLPMFVDNVVPTMLATLRILSFADCTEPALRDWKPEPQEGGASDVQGPCLSRDAAYRVRAAALAAGAQVVEVAHDMARASPDKAWLATMTEEQLDAYLWSRAKDPDLRCVPRLCERGTAMY
ncbi:hypothetical protein MCAP1_002584 [Malassezia caprae]|uniref:Queuosine 5'-phosphate N-glycosylase/hydrolase n=1 Tax=Malassezia caprae TaxID=1381934 RepID=A0AAF0E7N4_9BASI|nr:hypothetical protein MCAP1_002584 [Malassezia caprae]